MIGEWSSENKREQWCAAFRPEPIIPRPIGDTDVKSIDVVMPVTAMAQHLLQIGSRKLVNLSQELWAKELEIISHASGPAVPRATQALHTKCFQYGVCVCSSRHGQRVHACDLR